MFSRVRLLAVDIDGTLTDGRTTWIGESGGWVQTYSVRDGEAILQLKSAGIPVVPISRNATNCARVRMSHLKLPLDWLGLRDKLPALEAVSDRYGVGFEDICYIGDGPEDIPVLRVVGLGCTVRDAPPVVQATARFITQAAGGNHAVAELIGRILESDRPDIVRHDSLRALELNRDQGGGS